MPFEITHVHTEHTPAQRLIGKRYTRQDPDHDAVGGFGGRHRVWRENAWCQALAQKVNAPGMQNGMHGLMTLNADHEGRPAEEHQFAYWIGYLFPADTPVPDGFSSLDLPESDVGVAWIYGDCGDLFGEGPHNAALEKLREKGWGKLRDNAGGENTLVFFERYNPQRFNPDANGKFTLDYGFYLE